MGRKKQKLSDKEISNLIIEIKNDHRGFEDKYKNILEEYKINKVIDSNNFKELFDLAESYRQYNLPYSLFTKLIFEVDESIDLSDFVVELKFNLRKIVSEQCVDDLNRKKARIIAKIIEHTELAITQKNSLYNKQKTIIDDLTKELKTNKKELEDRKKDIARLNEDLVKSYDTIYNLTRSVNSHKFDLIAIMSVVFTIFTVLGVNTSIISALSTIKELNILEMIGLFVFGNITLTFMIWFIMHYSKKYYMDFINKK